MKSTVHNSMLAVSLLAALAATIPIVAQSGQTAGPRYRLIELGTLGGTYSQTFYVSSKGVTRGRRAWLTETGTRSSTKAGSRRISARLGA